MNRYPPPLVRPKVTPGKGVPMRQWSAPSYDPTTGRAASSIESQGSKANHASPNAQAPGGVFEAGGSWGAIDKSRTQGGDVRKRPLG